MKRLMVLACAVLLLVVVFAVFAADEDPAITSFKGTTLEMIGKVSNAGVPREQKLVLSEQYLKTNADFEHMGKFVLGRHFNSLSPENQKAFVQAFTDFFIATWDPRFAPLAGQTCMFTKTSLSSSTVTLESTMEGNGKPPMKLSWQIKKTGEKMKLMDLVINNSSLLVSFRQEFASIVISNGGSVPPLIKLLVDKTAAARK